jgi:RNA polymerase sigma factor (sigma-70 family)
MRSKKNGVIAEGDILKRLETGDPLALEMIWDRHSCDLLGYLMSILCSRTDAEDILQEVMVSIAQKHTVVARTDTLRPYLFRMARNHALNLLKRRRYEPVASTYADCWLIARESDGDDLVKYNQRPVQGPGDPPWAGCLPVAQDRRVFKSLFLRNEDVGGYGNLAEQRSLQPECFEQPDANTVRLLLRRLQHRHGWYRRCGRPEWLVLLHIA